MLSPKGGVLALANIVTLIHGGNVPGNQGNKIKVPKLKINLKSFLQLLL